MTTPSGERCKSETKSARCNRSEREPSLATVSTPVNVPFALGLTGRKQQNIRCDRLESGTSTVTVKITPVSVRAARSPKSVQQTITNALNNNKSNQVLLYAVTLSFGSLLHIPISGDDGLIGGDGLHV